MIRTSAWLALLFPAALGAQGLSLSTFGARNGGLAGTPAMAGAAITAWSGPVGGRVGGAMDLAASPAAALLGRPATGGVTAWSGEVDLVASAGRAGWSPAGLEPSAFVGFGIHGAGDEGARRTIPVWSYGAGLAFRPVSWASLDAEARYRMPHESDASALPPGVAGGWELRAGLSVHLGSGRRARPRPRPRGMPATIHIGGGAGPAGARGPADAARVADATLATGEEYLGVPYVWGGDSPQEGFDCSGFTRWVFARNGVHLPRVSRDQARSGVAIPARLGAVRAGDLLFFAGDDGVIDHVAIYAGDRRILHASGSRGYVGYDHLDSRRGRWYATHLVAARRVIR